MNLSPTGNSMYRIEHKGVSFYMLDTTQRTLGRTQFSALEEALKQDGNAKIFCSHIPMYGSSDLIMFSFADNTERNKLLALMQRYNVDAYISGHYHIGDKANRINSTMTEYVMGSFCGREQTMFGEPARWYVCRFDAPSGTLSITRFRMESPTSPVLRTEMETFTIQ